MLNEENVQELKSALIGRSVISVRMFDGDGPPLDERHRWGSNAQGEVRLDDGTVLRLAGNEGGCSCGAGDYFLEKLNDMPINGIMDVEVVREDDIEDNSWWEYTSIFRIFVLAQDDRIELATFEGSDGDGYNGTGFWFTVEGTNQS